MAGYFLRPEAPLPTHPSLLVGALGDPDWVRLRHRLNWINLSTPLGLLLAKIGGARIRKGPARSYLADYYRWTFPAGGAFTVGDVIITRHDLDLLAERRPTLVGHELLHSNQWAYCLGLPFLPLYVASMAWSWLRTGDRAARSFFEREAGLETGGYRDVEPRPLGPVIAGGARELLRVVGIGRKGLDAGADLGTAERDRREGSG
ncbi:hypothetical protein [Ornithinimicrobium panacihumi]|uniref:hypothetical protein n=1 Tax=Ornithinimicrobium panacihumi TaxID=2008449 RepID=UPI003F8CE4B2